MKKATELYALNPRELMLLELFELMNDDEQREKMCGLVGFLLGRGILSETDALKYYKELKKD